MTDRPVKRQSSSSTSTQERVVELLNQASLFEHHTQRLLVLEQVSELIVHKEPTLLDSFLDEMLAFQSDHAQDVRKFMVTFMEDACKVDNEILPKVAECLMILLEDESIIVAKKVILSMSHFYNIIFKWISKSKSANPAMVKTWAYINQIKQQLCELVDNDNDGIRTHSVKFLENIVMTLSVKTADSETSRRVNGPDVDLGMVYEGHPILNKKTLIDEGVNAFDIIVTFQASSHVSSVNLMTCMSALTTIAKERPQFMDRVIMGFEALHVNLPPTLAKSQVNSVRKNLKMKMLAILRHSCSYKYHSRITTLLTDLGATQSEVHKAIPKTDNMRKRRNDDEINALNKKARLSDPNAPAIPLEKDDDDDDEDEDMPSPSAAMPPPISKSVVNTKERAIDMTANDLIDRLTPQNVADLVLLSMVMLPEEMPAHFQSTYTPISAAGTEAQIKHMSRLLATQVTAAGLGVGYTTMLQNKAGNADGSQKPSPVAPPGPIVPPEKRSVPLPVPPPSRSGSGRKGIRQFKLRAVTEQLNHITLEKFALESVQRILHSNRNTPHEHIANAKAKLVVSLVCEFGGNLTTIFLQYIFADMRTRADLAILWLYQEYTKYMAYGVADTITDRGLDRKIANYDLCLTSLLSGVLERPDRREGMFNRLLLEAPCITPSAVHILKLYCQIDNRIYLGMLTLKELILKRPNMKLVFLAVLLDFTCHYKTEVRSHAVRIAKLLYERKELSEHIDTSALHYLGLLQNPAPPEDLFGLDPRDYQGTWVDKSIKLCLYLYLALLPVNHSLIHELASVYTSTSQDIKRSILRVLETPIKGIGMDSPELLKLVENCPKGSETLVTRIIHLLTDKVLPSPKLVERVRNLYQKRVSDVRFLIPVLNGLQKEEVIDALPKLIKLNPVVVKEVFNRLLGSPGEESSLSSPVAPDELLIALHNINPEEADCDMKTIIKATNICYTERGIYTQEVLASVMKQLIELPVLPTLFMRTVIQALAVHPKLMGFVLNIMQKLIVKQVWKQKKVWEGFVRCCQRTKPQSFQVLLQLPAAQLRSAFEISPELREPLLQHVKSFSAHQRAHIPKPIMSVLEKNPAAADEDDLINEAKKFEDEKLAEQESLYQKKLQEERMKQLSATSPVRMVEVDDIQSSLGGIKEIPLTLNTEPESEKITDHSKKHSTSDDPEDSQNKPTHKSSDSSAITIKLSDKTLGKSPSEKSTKESKAKRIPKTISVNFPTRSIRSKKK